MATMSSMVVTAGPAAMAGSILTSRKKNGTSTPRMADAMMATNMEIATVAESHDVAVPELAHDPRQDAAGETHEGAHHQLLVEEMTEIPEIHAAGGKTADHDGRRLRADVAAHGADDQDKGHEFVHVRKADLETVGQHRRHREPGEGGEQPRQPDSGDSQELVGVNQLGLAGGGAGHVHDVLVRLFLEDIDHVVVEDSAEQPAFVVDHGKSHEVVAFEESGPRSPDPRRG